ncbi:MAG: cysteine desulfurase family protein [Pseudomonadota bacterium]
MTPSVYLDYNATAPLRHEARDAVLASLEVTGNPSSVHGFGRAARSILETAREEVAALAGVAPRLVTFTSGGTEANQMALNGLAVERVLISAVEHPSVLKACDNPTIIPVDDAGRVDPDALDTLLAAGQGRALLSVMAANNETGVIQPLADIANVAHRHDAVLHVDTVQAAGKLDLDAIDADLMTLSGHKLGGPAGAGALVRKRELQLRPLMRGGGQELGLRAGTEPLSAIAGFGAAARACLDDDVTSWRSRRDRLEANVMASTTSAAVVAGDVDRLANTSALAMPGVGAETLVMAFDLAGVAVSAGSACSSGKVGPSHVLTAMGRDDIAANTVRISHGWATTDHDIDVFLAAWTDIARRLGGGQHAA